MADTADTTAPQPRELREIARDIRTHWKNPYFGAKPYIEAMGELGGVDEYMDGPSTESGAVIVRYFLSNAATWRGPDAKRIKSELRTLIGEKTR